jgi:hypothetical protein
MYNEQQIDPSVLQTVSELMDKKYYEEEIEEKLKKMGYNTKQIQFIFQEVKDAHEERNKKFKKWKFLALLASLVVFLLGISVIAIIQAL